MARKLKDTKLGFEKDKRKSAVDKSKSDVVPVQRGIYRPLPKGPAKAAPAKKSSPKKAKSPAKLRKAKSVKSNFRKQLNKTQRMRKRRGVKPSKNRCM